MAKVDSPPKNTDNASIIIQGGDEQIKIQRDGLEWQTFRHQHHYLPDFTDEDNSFVALTCVSGGCHHGALFRKKGKDFIKWLDTHRTTK